MKRLSAVGEFGFLKKLLPQLYWPKTLARQLVVGPGDDAGVVRLTPGHVLVASTDALIEGRHFERAWFPWEDLGYKALAVNLSDLAAMGAVRPIAALISAGFPGDTSVESVDKFYRGLESCAQQWKTGLLGGDTVGSREGWMISITILGEARPAALVRRGGARVGDWLFTTGPLGLASAGLEVLQKGRRGGAWTRPLVEAFSRPQPRFKAGAWLSARGRASSMMDCSDGLEASVRLLAEASGVGMQVDLALIPKTRELRRWAKQSKRPVWSYALSGGEDYELIFTAGAAQAKTIMQALPSARCIGRVTAARTGLWALTPEGENLPLKGYGFAHFKK